jgi:acyl carrier protein
MESSDADLLPNATKKGKKFLLGRSHMLPTIESIVTLLLQTVQEIQTISGRSASTIQEDIAPLRDLEGFDSLNALEATVQVGLRLGVELPETVFFAASNGSPVTSKQIASRILQHLELSNDHR